MTLRRRPRCWEDRLLAALTWFSLGSFLLLPVFWPAVSAWADGSAWKSAIGDLPRSLSLLRTTLELSLIVLTACLPLGVLWALKLTRYSASPRPAVWFVLLTGTFAPLSLYTGGWLSVVGPMGWIHVPYSTTSRWGGMFSAGVVHVLAGLPWAAASAALALRTVNQEWEEQGLLVAGPLTVLTCITLPVCIPFLVGASIVVAAAPLTDMTVSDLFVVRTFAEEVYTQFESGGDSKTAMLLNLPLTALCTAILVVAIDQMPQRMGETTNCVRLKAGWRERTLWAFLWLAAGMYLLPFTGLLWQWGLSSVKGPDQLVGLQWRGGIAWNYFQQAFESSLLHGDLIWDFVRAALAGALATWVASLLAWKFVRSGRGMQKFGVAAACLLFLTPGPVIGLAIIEIFNRPGPLGLIYDSMWILIYAATVRSLPFCLAVVTASIARLDEGLVDAARCEGASEWTILTRAVLPARLPALCLAFLIGAATAMNELAISKIVSPPGEDPLALRTFQLLHGGAGNEQAAQCLLLLLIIAVVAVPLYWSVRSLLRSKA